MIPYKDPEVQRALELRDRENYREALALLEKAAAELPDRLIRAHVMLEIVSTLVLMEQNLDARGWLDAARELFNELMTNSERGREDVSKLALWIELGDVEVTSSEGRLEESREKLNRLMKEYGSEGLQPYLREDFDYIKIQLGCLLVTMSKNAEALPILEDIASRYPDYPDVRFYLGHCCYKLGNLEKAKLHLETGLKLNLSSELNFQTHGSLGMTYHQLGDYQKARNEFEFAAQKATPEYIRRNHIWKWLESTCVALGLKEEALLYRQMQKPS